MVRAVSRTDPALLNLPFACGENMVDARPGCRIGPEAVSAARRRVTVTESGRVEGILKISPGSPVETAVAGHVEIARNHDGQALPILFEECAQGGGLSLAVLRRFNQSAATIAVPRVVRAQVGQTLARRCLVNVDQSI